MDQRIRADGGMAFNDDMGDEPDVIADDDVRTDRAVRTDLHALADSRRRIDESGSDEYS